MPKQNWRKVMVIGSGPIIIGQAAEFDYAGTQACRALREEGIETVLVNSNPATIMTDPEVADKVYIEPLTVEFLERIIEKERPDGLLPTMGGQTGLNLAFQLDEAGVLDRCEVKLMGTPLDSISKAEDRELFRNLMNEIGEKIPPSVIVNNLDESLKFADETGFPLIVRPAFTLGGTGGGIAHDEQSLKAFTISGVKASMIGQVLIEKSVAGWKEIEYEVLRDSRGNAITVCHMENMDPVGVHTGDSIVVAPCQTLTDREVQAMRTSALKIVDALGIEGGCNVQYALNPYKLEYVVIEVNPRLSRSSALASKATGYPIAKVATKIAIGYTMDELKNAVTGKTSAFFEPALDYTVVKIPRWPFDKFTDADRKIGTQMKATGEVMGLGRNLESALMKAVRSLEIKAYGLFSEELALLSDEEITEKCRVPEENLLFVLAEAFRRGRSVEEISKLANWNPYFLKKIELIVKYADEIKSNTWSIEVLRAAKRIGYSDREIAALWKVSEQEVYEFRIENGLKASFKMVDTCAGEFEAETPYFYSVYDEEDEGEVTSREKVVVLGSGPIRIGQGIEFDYCSVHAVQALRKSGIESIIINNNPETVSTDFDTADRLYFEPLTIEDVSAVLEKEKPRGVIVQFGGQTAIGLCKGLAARGSKILGTSVESIDLAEERGAFDDVLEKMGAKRPQGGLVSTIDDAQLLASDIGFPVMLRPSYVLGGRAMQIVYEQDELCEVFAKAMAEFPGQQIWIDQYLIGKEVEVDAISDGETVCLPGIMEHLERAGVHSGDSIAVYPPQTLSKATQDIITNLTVSIAKKLNTIGLINVQYVVHKGDVYVIEVNPRSSRTVPFLSKVTGVPIVELSTRAILGESLKSMGISSGLMPESNKVAVKVPVFSFSKLHNVEPTLGPEMKSTGEVMGIDYRYEKALYKGLLAAGMRMFAHGTLLVTLADRDKEDGVKLVKRFYDLGFRVIATKGTAELIEALGVEVSTVEKLHTGSEEIPEKIRNGQVQCVLNTTAQDKKIADDGFIIRRAAVEQGIPCFTSMDTAAAWLHVLEVNSPSLLPLE